MYSEEPTPGDGRRRIDLWPTQVGDTNISVTVDTLGETSTIIVRRKTAGIGMDVKIQGLLRREQREALIRALGGTP